MRKINASLYHAATLAAAHEGLTKLGYSWSESMQRYYQDAGAGYATIRPAASQKGFVVNLTSSPAARAEARKKLRAAALEETLTKIAQEHLHLETLATRNSDSADFSTQAVWSLAAALEAAYEAGKKAR